MATDYHGVYFNSTKGRFQAQIRNGKYRLIPLGAYPDAESAARAWDHAARILRGRDTEVNFPHDPVDPVQEERARRRIATHEARHENRLPPDGRRAGAQKTP